MLSFDDLPSNVVDRATFAACTNDISRIGCLLSSPDFTSILTRSLPQLLDEQKTFLKCAKTSSEHREQGNAAYASHNDRLALSLYNQAIRYAPSYSHELSLALGNRSAALVNLKHYDLALNDIHRSLDLFSTTDENEPRRQRLDQRQQQCLQHLTEDQNNHDKNDGLQCELDRIRNENSFNSNYPSLTSHADIRVSTDRGRHVVSADAPLMPGTIILVEQAYASVLLPSSWSTHCHMCLRRLDLVLFACSQCTRALYCSNECLQRALVWHAFECRLTTDRLEKMSMLTLRLITKTGWQYLIRNRNRLENFLQNQFNPSEESDKEKKYEWNNYENILRLETNSNNRTTNDLFDRCVQACLIGISFINNTCFCPQALDNLDLRIYLCSLICSHLQSLPCNAHEISEFVHHRRAPLTSSCIEIGAGIFATLSLFNHSCNPLVNRNFIRDTVVVRLLGSVNSSAVELTDNYGCLSATMIQTDRHEKLKEQYHFQCQCEACEYQWPNYDQLPEGTGGTNVESHEFNDAFTRLIEGQVPVREDLDTFEKFIAQCDKEIPTEQRLKGKMYNNAQEAYKQCLNFFHHSMHTED